MKKNFRFGLILVALLLCLSIFVIGCDNGKDNSESSGTTESTAAEISETSEKETSADTSDETSAETSDETSDETSADTSADTDADKEHVCADSKSDADHKCDECGKVLGTCVDTDPKDHKCDECGADTGDKHEVAKDKHTCDYCGEKIGELVDFGGSGAFVSYDKGTEKYEKELGRIKISNKNATGGGTYGTNTNYVIPGHIYEITYTLRRSDPAQTRMTMRFIQGEITSPTADETKDSGYLGWVIAKSGSKNINQIATNNIQYASGAYAAVDRDIGAVNDEQYFKVVVDGFTNTMTLYVLKGSEYVFVNSMTFTLSSPNLNINTGAWDTFTGDNFVELDDVTVYSGCVDANSDHLCDVCGAKLSEHTDAASDGDHKCDYCGAANITECKNTNGDHACDTDPLCEKFIDHAYVGGTCSICKTAEHTETDANGDNKCDTCGVKIDRTYLLADHKDRVKIYGRSFELVRGIACDYSGSGIEFKARVSGDVVIKVESESVSYYTLYINGERQEKRLSFANGTAEYTIAEDLAAGEYTFKLVKQTQAPHSLSVILSLKINGALLERPADNDLLIEFIGDSITCGYALIDGYTNDNAGAAAYMDASKSYAYLAAQKLGADHSLMSFSGWAVLPSAPGVENGCVPAVYGKTSYRRGEAAYAPDRTADIVVIHLGTNDLYSRDAYDDDFVKAAKEFIADVKKMNPNAKIVWAYGSMMSGSNLPTFKGKVNTIINDLGGEAAGFYSVQLPTDTSGGRNHPSVAAQEKSATTLADFIRNTVLK